MNFNARAQQIVIEAETQSTHAQFMLKVTLEVKTFSLILLTIAEKSNIVASNIVSNIVNYSKLSH